MHCMSPEVTLTTIRYTAQNSVAIGGTADIIGLEEVGGSVENDPKRRLAGSKSRTAARP
jgi:hypothetical protein